MNFLSDIPGCWVSVFDLNVDLSAFKSNAVVNIDYKAPIKDVQIEYNKNPPDISKGCQGVFILFCPL